MQELRCFFFRFDSLISFFERIVEIYLLETKIASGREMIENS